MQTATDIETQAYRARPEPGQLVEVRRRQWVVAQVNSSKLESNSASQNCVTLSSIDEDGLGEELEVIWELEPGAQVIELGVIAGHFGEPIERIRQAGERLTVWRRRIGRWVGLVGAH